MHPPWNAWIASATYGIRQKAKGSRLGEAVWKSKCNHVKPSYSHSARAAWSANKLVRIREICFVDLWVSTIIAASWHRGTVLWCYPGFPASQQPAEQMNTKFKRDVLAAGPPHQPCGATETAPCRCLRTWCRDGKQHVKLLVHLSTLKTWNDMKGTKDMMVFYPPVLKWCWYGFAMLWKLFKG